MNHIEHYNLDAKLFSYELEIETAFNEQKRNEFIIHHFPVKKHQKVLEVGSGRGWFSLAMANSGIDITACDLSKENLEKIKSKNENIQITYADAYKLPFANETFDWIVFNEVLEHLEFPKKALNEFYRCLKPRGRILFTVPYNEQIPEYLCIHCNKKTPRNAHLHSFDEKKINEILNHTNFYLLTQYKFMNRLFNFAIIEKINSKHCPLNVWIMIDKIFNYLFKRENYILTIAQKKC